MIKPMILGLTGPTGSGKSTASAAMSDCDCVVLDADREAREVVQPGSPCVEELVAEFGEEIRKEDGGIVRSRLAQLAFSSPEKTKRLNEITHPWIIKIMLQKIEELTNEGKCDIIVLDAPLLFEAHMEKICDFVVTVTAPLEKRIERIMKRDAIDRDAALLRISAQNPERYYTTRADYILYSNRRTDDLYHDAVALIEQLREEQNVKRS